MKCFGEFVCSKCGAIIKQKFDIKPEEIGSLYVDCPICGKHVETYIPTKMRAPIMNLASKGYKMRMFNEKTLAIVLNMKIDPETLPRLPHEFIYNTLEPEGDIIVNDRLASKDGYEGYYEKALENLYDFCTTLPTISDGVYLDLTKEDEDHV